MANLCSPNFPFTELCNGHGLCLLANNSSTNFVNAACLCDAEYVGNFVDTFLDSTELHCFLPRAPVVGMWWALLGMCSVALCRPLMIFIYWIRQPRPDGSCVQFAMNTIIEKPHLQNALLKVTVCLLGIAMSAQRLFSSQTMSPVGQSFCATILYSLAWLSVFTDSLIFLNRNLAALSHTALMGGNMTITMGFIKKVIWIMFVAGCICFSIGPVTFLLPLGIKWHMSVVVFGVEIALFLSYAALVGHVVLLVLCPQIYDSITFLESQLTLHENTLMRDRMILFMTLHQTLRKSALQSVVQYCVLGFCRVILLMLPHALVFFVWFDMVCELNIVCCVV